VKWHTKQYSLADFMLDTNMCSTQAFHLLM